MPKNVKSRLEKLCKHYETHPVIKSYKPRLSEIHAQAPVWSIFYKQNDAVRFSQSLNQETLVLAVENVQIKNASTGARKFIVSGIDEFWFYYKNLPNGKRHFYEVIQAETACHLYFDLEFDKTTNIEKNGHKMVKSWICYVAHCISKEFNIITGIENVLQLDSTTTLKFSQHLIWHLPNAVFKNNIEVGCFVHLICKNLLEHIKNSKTDQCTKLFGMADLHHLMVNKADGSKDLFVDQGVYTKNRNFRLFLSSKLGKSTELNHAACCQFKLQQFDQSNSCCVFHSNSLKSCKVINDKITPINQLIFLASLITNVKYNDCLTIIELTRLLPHRSTSRISSTKSETSTASHKSNLNFPYFQDDNFQLVLKQLLEFVVHMVQVTNPNGAVKKWTYFSSNNMILYDIKSCRFCHNIQREHKSNGIMYVADLSSHSVYQKCYDPVCRQIDFRSNPIAFPLEIAANVVQCKTDIFADCDDSLLLETVESLELISGNESVATDDEMLNALQEVENVQLLSDVSDKDMMLSAMLIENESNNHKFDISDYELCQAVSTLEGVIPT